MRPKRLISLLVAVCMMITMLPLSAVTAFAADTASSTKHTTTINGFECTYTVNADNTATITRFYEPDTTYHGYNIDIPETLDGYTVTAIGDSAFYECYYLRDITIPQSVKSIGREAFYRCTAMESLTIKDAATSIGEGAFEGCDWLTTVKLGEHITMIGEAAFVDCERLDNVTIPDSVTSIGDSAFARCYQLKTISLGKNIETIGDDYFVGVIDGVFFYCTNLSKIIIPEKVKTIERNTFVGCSNLESITLPAGLTTFKDSLDGCSPDCVIYYNGNEHDAEKLRENNPVLEDAVQKGHQLLCRCNVTFDANGGTLTDKGGNPTDHAVVSAYKTQKINADDLKAIPNPTRAGYNFTGWYTKDGTSLNVNEITTKDMTKDITFYANWAPVYHPLTVTGGTATVEKDGQSLVIDPVVTGDKKTYSVPEGAEVTVTLDKTAVPNGKVFDGWSTGNLSLPTGQDYKAENITFTMNSDVDIAAQYRDAATDHTPDTAVCHPLTLKDGVITSVTVTGKNGADPEDITEIVKKNANEDGSFNVPEGATVSVAFDKDAFADSGLKFGHWDITGLDDPNAYQDKESFAFVMPAKGVTLKAMTQDASIEDDEPDIVGPIVIGTTVVVGGAVLGYQAYSLGAEFAGKLMALPYFPSNRSALAMMLWEDAGKPMPESELLYPDIEQEEQDMDLQHAARWAMENELIPDLNDEGTAPEEMKFYPDNTVSKLDVLNAWQKAQELKQNA